MQTLPRRAVRAIAVTVPVLLTLGLADSAAASEPTTWAPGEGYSTMTVLLIYVGIPLGLVIGISLVASINPGKYADYYPVRPKAQHDEDWFGGHAEIEDGHQAELAERPDAPKPGGGASASW